jgi:diguanylate cyclase (GGDEF)-like protein/PAS domain S-box-containing protein
MKMYTLIFFEMERAVENKKIIDDNKTLLDQPTTGIQNNPWRTIIIYLVFGFAWILFSDRILEVLITDHEQYLSFQTYKGWFYVLFTAGLLYVLIRMDNRKIFTLNYRLTEKNQDLVVFSEEMIAIEEELQNKIDALNSSMEALERHKKYIDGIYNNSSTVIVIWNLDGIILEVNDHYTSLLGYEKEEAVGKSVDMLLAPNERFSLVEHVAILQTDGYLKNHEHLIMTKSGAIATMLWNDKVMNAPDSDETYVVSFGIDITLEREKETQIIELAYKDRLTGLKNKVVFEQELNELIERNQCFVLYYIDFDNFKNLNDVLGHDYGDQFLLEYSKAVKTILDKGHLYRWSGDEFFITELTDDESHIRETIERLMKLTKRKWHVSKMEYYPSISLGITRYPSDGINVTELLKNVEMALYKSKEAGKGQCRFFDTSYKEEVARLIHIESSINRIIQSEAFELYYQPIFQLDTLGIIGIEALLRWNLPDLGINTGEFIDVAERTGQIVEVDRWVIDEAFQFVRDHLTDHRFHLSINLSTKSLISSTLLPMIEDKLATYGIPSHLIEFEITEHSLIENFDQTLEVIRSLKDLGFNIALDDFGTRFSSLNYLSKIPFDTLKVDKSYIDHVTTDGKDRLIVEQIIQLSERLGIKTIAEGVEYPEQRKALEQMKCNYGQGYLMSRPISKTQICELLKAERSEGEI